MPVRSSRGKPLVRLTMALAAMGLFLIGYYWGNQYKSGDSSPPAIEGILVRPPVELPGFDLQDATGKPFTAESFAEHWTLLSFGDLGQATGHLAITRMVEVRNRLASDPDLQMMLQLLLASERQDLSLARDLGRLSPSIGVLSGDSGELQRLRASVGALPPGQEATGASADEIPFYLIGPSGRLVALFTGAQAPSSIASDLSAVAEHSISLYPSDEDE